MLPTFDPSKSTFDLENAYVLMRACQATYAVDRDSYLGRLDELGISSANQKWFQSQFDACFLGWTDNWAILSFRGTANAGGWVSNLARAIPEARTKDYYGRIHPGFADGLDALWNDFFGELSSPAYADKPLFITGHSRGGAIATLAAQSLFYRGIKPVAVYTFGAPRAGNTGFANRYDIKHHYRIENDRDIVPHVPSRPLFTHVGERHWINSTGDFDPTIGTETPDSAVVLAALATVAGGALGVGSPLLGGVLSHSSLTSEYFSDHANTEYAYWLWNMLPTAARNEGTTTTFP